MEDLGSAESQGKCIKQYALTAAKNARSLSSRLKADLSIAGIATKNIGQRDIDNNISIVFGSLSFLFIDDTKYFYHR